MYLDRTYLPTYLPTVLQHYGTYYLPILLAVLPTLYLQSYVIHVLSYSISVYFFLQIKNRFAFNNLFSLLWLNARLVLI